MPRTETKKLTLKDRGLLKLVAECDFNEHEAARRLKITSQSVNQRMRKIRKKTDVNDMMNALGLTTDFLMERVKRGADAMRVISANIVVTKSDDPTVEDQEAHSRTKDFIEVPDEHARHKYIQTALELQGLIRKSNSNGYGPSITIVNYGHRNKRDSITVRS